MERNTSSVPFFPIWESFRKYREILRSQRNPNIKHTTTMTSGTWGTLKLEWAILVRIDQKSTEPTIDIVL